MENQKFENIRERYVTIQQKKNILGGRNISLEYDKWGSTK